jgi:hypothetical protein
VLFGLIARAIVLAALLGAAKANALNVFPALKDGDFCNQRRTFSPDT